MEAAATGKSGCATEIGGSASDSEIAGIGDVDRTGIGEIGGKIKITAVERNATGVDGKRSINHALSG